MERPTMKENLKGYSLEEAHKLYTDCPELYRHIVKLDEYIDDLEDQLHTIEVSGGLRSKEAIDYEIYAKRKDKDENLKGWVFSISFTIILFLCLFGIINSCSS